MRQLPLAYARQWLLIARRDLRTAEGCFVNDMYDACVVYAQQAVEKALKAHWVLTRDEEPPKSHALSKLAAQLGLLSDLVDDLHDLETDYIQTRYPDMNLLGPEAYDASVAEERLKLARHAMARLAPGLQEVDDDSTGGA